MQKELKNRTARHLAVLCLLKWDRERLTVQQYIESVVYGSPLNASDRQLAVMLVNGVLRQMQYLDSIISRFAKHPLKKMKPLTLMTLRVGVYQLLFLDRVPDSAAVNEMVKVVKAERQPRWMVNFTNGVLRAISRQKTILPSPDQAGEEDHPVLNHPDWLVNRWQERFGERVTDEICRINNKEPFLVVRVNTLLTDAKSLADRFRNKGIEVREGRFTPNALAVEQMSGPVSSLPGYDDGLFHVQDEAAQLVTLLLGPFEGKGRYLDGCAGLGGKTCQLAQLIPAGGDVLAVEPSKKRNALLQENLLRLNLRDTVQIFPGSIGDFLQQSPGQFNGILIDAPCSGTGVIRRHPDIRWNRTLSNLQRYKQQQLEILQNAAFLLRPGGVLVYATCSLEPEENEEVIETFMAQNEGFSVTDAGGVLPEPAKVLVNSQGYFSTTPASGLDGFFGARLVKAGK